MHSPVVTVVLADEKCEHFVADLAVLLRVHVDGRGLGHRAHLSVLSQLQLTVDVESKDEHVKLVASALWPA